MRFQHLLTRKQEKPFKDTLKFKPKQGNTNINSKEMKATNRLCWHVTGRHAHRLSKADSDGCKWLLQAIAVVIFQRTD